MTTYVLPVRAQRPDGTWAALAAGPARSVARSGDLIGPVAPTAVSTAAVTANAVTNPASSGTGAYAEVQQGCSTARNYDNSATAPLGAGLQNFPGTSCQGIYRSFFRINTGNLNSSMHVEQATLLTAEQWASDLDCTHAWPVTVKWTGGISSGTDWSNQPGVVSTVQTQDPKSAACGTVDVNFDVTGVIQQAAAGNWLNWTYGLYGDEANHPDSSCAPSSSFNCGFMRFNDNPSITTVFDIAPDAPANPALIPTPHDPGGAIDQGCNLGGSYGWIGRTDLGGGGSSGVTIDSTVTSNIIGESVRGEVTFFKDTTPNAAGESGYVYVNSPYVASGTRVGIAVPGPLADGQRYGYRVFANDGTQISADSTGECYFNVDLTSPTVPVVTSSDFPPSGSGTVTVKRVGGTGTFSLSSTDPAPATCGTTCLSSGVAKYEYSFNTPVPASGAKTVAAGGTLSFTPAQWGTNILYVDAVDNAGNRSQVAQYDFYVPATPGAKAEPGDINGDGVPDLLATDTAGDLLLYPGNTDPAIAPVIAGTKATSPEDGFGWNDFQITHRGSMSEGGVDDLFAHKGPALYIYDNGDGGSGQFADTANVTSPVPRPSCTAGTNGCAGYATSDWSAATQVLAPGDVFGGGTPSLLTVENDQLWAFQAAPSGDHFVQAVLLGTSGWKNMTLIAPGPVGGVLTLWARDTGSGTLYSYPLTVDPGSKLPSSLGPATGPASRATPVTTVSLPAGTYPTLASPGDVTGNGTPGLYAEDTAGNLWYYPGQSTAGGAQPLPGTRNLVGALDDATAEWPLSDGSGTTAADVTGHGHDGTLNSGVSWVAGTARGTVAAFDGATGGIATSGPVLDTSRSYSVAAWAYLTRTGDFSGEVASEDGATNSAFLLRYIGGAVGRWALTLDSSDSMSPVLVDAKSASPAAVNTWTHLVGTYDATTGQLDLYVNGALAATAVDATAFAASGPFEIGRGKWLGKTVDFFPGQVSDVQAFGYALTAAEVRDLAQGQASVSQLS
jgi:hypothetical protein